MRSLPLFHYIFSRPVLRAALLPSVTWILSGLLASCSNTDSIEIWRQIPIQMTRVYQTDSYRQTFLLGTREDIVVDTLTREERQELDARMDRIFIQLIGARNWQHLKNLYGVSSIRDELIARKVHMEGLVNLAAYVDPLDHNHIILEGTGRFFAVRDRTGIILMSGDYHIAPQRFHVDRLKSGCIPMEVTIYTTRIPGKPTYYKDAVIHYDLMLTSVDDKGKAFSVDYRRVHPGYIDLNNDDRYDESELFAALTMNRRYHQAKLLDLSGLSFVKKNYDISEETKLEARSASRIDGQKSCVSG